VFVEATALSVGPFERIADTAADAMQEQRENVEVCQWQE
jgi:hypothetical protein